MKRIEKQNEENIPYQHVASFSSQLPFRLFQEDFRLIFRIEVHRGEKLLRFQTNIPRIKDMKLTLKNYQVMGVLV